MAMDRRLFSLIAISVLAVRYRTRFPYLFVGWLWYVGTLVPVIGIVQVGGQALADRYSYIPSIGLFIIAGWGLADLFGGLGFSNRLLAAVEGGVIAACMATSWLQIGYWHDSITLWKHAIECADSDLARLNLGQALAEAGARPEAREQLLLALTLNPKNAKANFNLGRLLDEEGKPDEAIARYTEALRLDPAYTSAHGNLAIALARQGKLDLAINHFILALRSDPDDVKTHYNLALAFFETGRRNESIHEFSEALRLDPNYAPAQEHLRALLNEK